VVGKRVGGDEEEIEGVSGSMRGRWRLKKGLGGSKTSLDTLFRTVSFSKKS
jgi:hypothetical protein